MPIVTADIEFRLSGGAANTAPNSSLGGAMSTVAGGLIADAVANNLWDDVSGAESTAGDTEYRAFYVQNQHDTLTLQSAFFWISSDTTSADTDFEIGLATEAVGVAIAETIANENTAPTGVTFSNTAVSKATGLSIGNIPGNSYKGLWIKRVVTAGAAAASDTGTVRVEGDTAA